MKTFILVAVVGYALLLFVGGARVVTESLSRPQRLGLILDMLSCAVMAVFGSLLLAGVI